MIINVHEHIRSTLEAPALLRLMDKKNIEKTILLGSPKFTLTSDYRFGFSEHKKNNEEILSICSSHPDRFEAWPTIGPLDKRKSNQIYEYYCRGATGLKLYLGHGFREPVSGNYTFSSIAMDDPELDELYSKCVTHNIPICYHINPSKTTPGFADEFVSVLQRFPKLRVNAPHWILSSGKPSRLDELLTSFPYLSTDISFGSDQFLFEGLRRISRISTQLRSLILRFPTRFMFGTDFVVTDASHKTERWMAMRIDAYMAMLQNETFMTELIPNESLRGLNLPEDVVRKILYTNYEEFRTRDATEVCSSSVSWSRFGFERPNRPPGRRLTPFSGICGCG